MDNPKIFNSASFTTKTFLEVCSPICARSPEETHQTSKERSHWKMEL